ncbi:unnamed protein product, partial [Arabidopsis lyrata]
VRWWFDEFLKPFDFRSATSWSGLLLIDGSGVYRRGGDVSAFIYGSMGSFATVVVDGHPRRLWAKQWNRSLALLLRGRRQFFVRRWLKLVYALFLVCFALYVWLVRCDGSCICVSGLGGFLLSSLSVCYKFDFGVRSSDLIGASDVNRFFGKLGETLWFLCSNSAWISYFPSQFLLFTYLSLSFA